MKTKPNDPINPHNTEQEFSPLQKHGVTFRGLTKREYFAALALQGAIAANDHSHSSDITAEGAQEHAMKAVMCADFLIAELNKEPEHETK